MRLPSVLLRKSLFGCLYGNFPEFFHHLADVESVLAGAGTGGLVPFLYLCSSIFLEFSDFCIDFFNEFFHNENSNVLGFKIMALNVY